MSGTVPYNDSSVSTSNIPQSEVNVEGSQPAVASSNSKAYTSAACLGLAIASGMIFPDQTQAATEPSVGTTPPVIHPSTNANDSEPWQPSLLRTVSEMNQNQEFSNSPVVKQEPVNKGLDHHFVNSESRSESSEPVVPSELFPQSSTPTYNSFQPHSVKTDSATVELTQPVSIPEVDHPTAQTVYTQPKVRAASKFSNTLKATGTVVIEPDLNDHSVSVVYHVTFGDTLAQIASRHQVPIETLIQTNELSDPNHIEVNQSLKIPQKSTAHQSSKFSNPQALAALPTLDEGNRPLFNSTVIPSVLSADVKTPIVRKPLSVPLGTSVLSQMAAEAGDSGAIALRQLALAQPQNKPTTPKPIHSSVLSTPLMTDDRSGVQPTGTKAHLSSQPTQYSDSNGFSVTTEQSSTKVYTSRLRDEVNRLRAEYQAQQAYQFVNASWESESEEQSTPATPSMVQLADRLRRVNPEFNPQQTEATEDVSEQIAQQPEPSDSQSTSGQLIEQLRTRPAPQKATRDEVVATAPLGSSAYDPLQNPAIGRIVSPELPPLPGPDAYLPGGSMRFNGYIWPSQGILTSGYGWRWGRMHRGIDIAAPIGTPIFAAAPGVVVYAGWNSGGYGNLVEIEHPDGSVTLYAHNSQILVNKGQKVNQGQQISTMGSTGRSTGPHLHFEIHPSGNGAVNPMALLPQERSNLSRY